MTDPTYRVTFERDEGQQYVIGARVTAIDPPVPLHAFVHADDANAVAARALHLINGHAHHVAPVSTLTSSSCSCGSIK